jgi:hypothetical protein
MNVRSSIDAELVQELVQLINDRLRADPYDLQGLTDERADTLLREFHERQQIEAGAVRASRHVIITGRRGAGKTSTMLRTFVELWKEDFVCVWVDAQTIDRDAPHATTVGILVPLLAELQANLNTGRRFHLVRDALSNLIADLLNLGSVRSIKEVSEKASRHTGKSSSSDLSLDVTLGLSDKPAELGLHGRAAKARSQDSTAGVVSERRYTMDPWQELETMRPRIQKCLQDYRRLTSDDPAFVFVDDFYFIPQQYQSQIADFLHRVTKNLRCWLKLGAVKHRLEIFNKTADPPVGIEVPHDATEVSLDVSLDRFAATCEFLERILEGIASKAGVHIGDLFAERARERLVLASGGVPRDYLSLAATCLEIRGREPLWERVNSELVYDVAPNLLTQKYADLERDTNEFDRTRLKERLRDVHDFCIGTAKANVLLVSNEELEVTPWGRDISTLADLRFIHFVGPVTVKTSDKRYVGVRYSAFCLDLSAYAGQRVRQITQVEFWKKGRELRAKADTADGAQTGRHESGRQLLRLRRFVYQPTTQRKPGLTPELFDNPFPLPDDDQMLFVFE